MINTAKILDITKEKVMIEIICAIISGVFAIISAVFGGISIYNCKQSNKQNLSSGNNCNNMQFGENNHDKNK